MLQGIGFRARAIMTKTTQFGFLCRLFTCMFIPPIPCLMGSVNSQN